MRAFVLSSWRLRWRSGKTLRPCGFCVGFVLLLACLVVQAQGLSMELREAQAVVTVQGQTTSQTVSLPYHWDRRHVGVAGKATFELTFNLPEVPTTPFGLYLPRLGNAYEIWLNGTLLQRNGDLEHFNGADFAKVPRHIVISPGLLRTSNLFRVHIRADVGRHGGLAPLTLGPVEAVYPLYLNDYRWRYLGTLIVVILGLLIGGVALALWVTQVDASAPSRSRRDRLYLLAGLAEWCWTIRISEILIEDPPLPWPWWGITTIVVATAMWACCMALFCIEVAGWSRLRAVRWLRPWLGLLLVTSFFSGMGALLYGYPAALTLWYMVLTLTFLFFIPLFIWKAVRGASLPHKMVTAAVLLNTLAGLRDLYMYSISSTYGGMTLMRYSSVLFGLTLGYIVITRFHAASGQARDLLANLAARVQQKEQELAQSYQRVEQLAREQERTAERTRILRDMHDGVGSHISTAIRQLQSGKASTEELLHTLRDSLDQLKLSIDAMNLPPGDITALLANLRYRLEPRLRASDIALQWDVDLLPPLPRLDDKAMRHLQFMVFEALSNVLQHAHASVLRIELRSTPAGGARLRVIDNGTGFEPERVQRRGLGSLRERAAAIHAGLVIASVPGSTEVEITLD